MIRIVIGGASPTATDNRGDEAVFANFCEGLRRILPDCRITALVRHPSSDFDRLFRVRSIRNFDHQSKQESLGRWFNGFNPGDDREHLKEIRKAMAEADLVVIGGSPFEEISDDQFMCGQASFGSLLAALSLFMGKPFVVYALQQGQIQRPFTKAMARFVCANAELVTVRESFSLDRLKEAGVPVDQVKVLADPAFGLDPINTSRQGSALLEAEKIFPGDRPLIGITFRHVYWRWDNDRLESLTEKMAVLCDFITEALGADVLLIPNQTYSVDMPFEDDRVVAERIWNQVRNRRRVHRIHNDYPLPSTLSLFPLLSMVIANRRHSCAFAAIHQVSPLALATENEWNIQPLMHALGLDASVLDFVPMGVEDLKHAISKQWMERDSVAASLPAVVESLREAAHQHTELIAGLAKGTREC